MFASSQLGVDLGTMNVRLFSQTKGLLFDEPATVAYNRQADKLMAIGQKAKQMIGKTSPHVEVTYPLRNGVIADFDRAKALLQQVFKQFGLAFKKPDIVMSVPFHATSVERRSFYEIAKHCGAKHIHFIQEPVAAAIGADLPVGEPVANVVVHLGGYDDYQELPYASSLCAACTEACPVKIPLHELLIKHRQIIVEREGKAPVAEKLAMKAFRLGTASPSLYRFGTKLAPSAFAPFVEDGRITKGPGPLKAWTESREFPAPSKERFRDWFRNRQKGGNPS